VVELRPHYPISTARLRLRPLTSDDVDALLAYRSDAEVCRFLPFEPMDAQVLQQRLAKGCRSLAGASGAAPASLRRS